MFFILWKAINEQRKDKYLISGILYLVREKRGIYHINWEV